MITIVKADGTAERQQIEAMRRRAAETGAGIEQSAREIMEAVRQRGYEAVREYSLKFDGNEPYEISKTQLKAAADRIDGKLLAALQRSGENIRAYQTELLTRTDDLKLLGLHNFENVMVASAMALHAGVPMETVRKVIQEFAGVEHRIEYVCEKDGVAYYNDSKGTNPDAAIKGIQAMNRPTLLIGGGYDKQSTYEEWIQAFDGKVRFLVLIGDTKEKIAKAARNVGFNDIIMADNLKEAVQICHDKANAGDAVLLSPACASWDQFKSYEQRGELFKEYVRAL